MSRGPSENVTPVRCTTVELKDLADTDEFDLDAEVGSVYGFEYTDSGYYKRKEIDDKKIPRLEQLKNVTAEFIGNHEYKISRVQNKWHLTPIIEWDVKFEFISPYIMFDSDNRFRKALNAGPVHSSLVPNADSRGLLEIKPFKKQYLLHSSRGQVSSGVTFIPEIPLAKIFTLVLQISIHESSLKNTARESLVVMGGIQINWNVLTEAEQNLTLVVRKDDDTTQGVTNIDKVDVHIIPVRLTSLSYLNLVHFDLIGLHYVKTALPDKLIGVFVKQ